MWHRLDPVQPAILAPGSDGRNGDVQFGGGCPGRVASVATLPGRAGQGAFWAATGDGVLVAEPLDLVGRERPLQAWRSPFVIEVRGDLPVGVARRELSDPADHGRLSPAQVGGPWRAGDLQGRAGLGLPADGDVDG